MSHNVSTPVFATHHINVLRGAFYSAFLALIVGLVELFSDAWIMEYGIDSPMVLIVAGFAVFSGCNAYLESSVRVEVGESHLKVSRGIRLLTGRSAAIPWEQIHTATVFLSPKSRGWFYRYLHRRVRDSIRLEYRWPEKKMVAVPLDIPLGGLSDVPELLKWIEAKADPTWKVYRGGMGSGERTDGEEVIQIVEEAFHPPDRALPERNERDSRTVLGENSECEIQNAERRSPRRRQLRMKKETDGTR